MHRLWRVVAVLAVLYPVAVQAAPQVTSKKKPARVASQVLVRSMPGAPAIVAPRVSKSEADLDRFSSMGRLAHLAATGQLDRAIARARAQNAKRLGKQSQYQEPPGPCDATDDGCDADDEQGDGPAGGQAELSVAIDSTGQHIVVGANDTRGFALNPVSVSGFSYSDDGGVTFVDGGSLPVNTGTTNIGATILPQVFGDPEIKYMGGSNFIYFSIMVQKFGTSGTVQTMCMHRSTDYGHTWTGPFEITPASNPHGLLSGANARDAADKEFADVDPDSGRVMMSWSNFTSTAFAAGGVEISTTFSDNVMGPGAPVWSTRSNIAHAAADGQASLPRFVGNGSPDVYVAWRRFPGGNNQNVGFARSTDNGLTWSAPINTTSDFFTMDQVLGNDRNNTSPGLAVDNSGNPVTRGNIYLVFANNNNHDGADVAFQRSTDGGLTWSAAALIDSRPGADRAQWFPWVNVDNSTGRVWVFYYDQGIATSGDLTETTYLYSDNGGLTWSRPAPLTDRPFHAGYGNDTGQPNIGDYNQAVAQNGELFAVWAGSPVSVSFTDGEPTSSSMTVPDVYFKRLQQALPAPASLSIAGTSFTDQSGNGYIDPGEQVSLRIDLRNYVTNPSNAGPIGSIGGTLSTATPGVSVTTASASYGTAAPGATATQVAPYVLQLSPSFVAGTPIDLVLNVTSGFGSATLLYRQSTGTPNPTPLLVQDFNAGTAPGWATQHGGGNNTIPWVIANAGFMGATNFYMFHQNANDGLSGAHTRTERLLGPNVIVPANSEYVTLDFDVAYNTEDDPAFNIQAYDGFLLRIVDFTPGSIARNVAAEAYAEEFTTVGVGNFYPKHMPRNSNTAYLQDLSAWAGNSAGFRHVHMKLPGMAGTTAQLRFEFTQDSNGICTDVGFTAPCGVAVDNIVMNSVTSAAGTITTVAGSPNPSFVSQNVTFTASVSSGSAAVTVGTVTFREGASILAAAVALDGTGHASFSTSSLSAGLHTITASYSGSAAYAFSQGSTTQLVKASSATTTTVAASAGQYSDVVTLSATVSPVSLPDRPDAAGSVQFTVNGVPAGTATLTATGLVSVPYIIGLPQGSYSVTATFVSSNIYFSGSAGASTLAVSRENAIVTAGSTSPVKVTTAGGTASFSLTASIVEVADGSLGNISNAVPVTFTLTPILGGASISTTATTTGGGVGGTLLASASFSGVPVNVYDVTISIGGAFYTGSTHTGMIVFDPSLGFATGGGTLVHGGVGANFGFNFKYRKDDTVQGNLNYVEHRSAGDVTFSADSASSVSIVGNTAIVIGKGSLGAVSNYSFRLIIVDNGEPGRDDQFGLQVTDPSGAVVSGLSFGPVTISGGNLQTH